MCITIQKIQIGSRVEIIKCATKACDNYLFSQSSGILPQKPQGSPDSLKLLFWLAQVPENSPFFLPHILMAIPAKPNASNPNERRNSFMYVNFAQRYVFIHNTKDKNFR